MRVRVGTTFENPDMWFPLAGDPVPPLTREHINNRRKNAVGTVANALPGGMWYVKHDTGEVAVYTYREFQLVE